LNTPIGNNFIDFTYVPLLGDNGQGQNNENMNYDGSDNYYPNYGSSSSVSPTPTGSSLPG
jgi:hypothetical protein